MSLVLNVVATDVPHEWTGKGLLISTKKWNCGLVYSQLNGDASSRVAFVRLASALFDELGCALRLPSIHADAL